MSDSLRVALIIEPTGNHLSSLYAAARNPEVGEVAVLDTTGEMFDAAKEAVGDRVTATYTDPDALFSDFKPAATLVTLEAWRMPAMIEASLDAGCHVWHEKPGFADLDDYRRLYCKAQATGLNLSIAYVSRQRAIVQEARRIVAEGLLGDLFACQAWFIADHDRTHQWATLQGGWIFDKARSGGGYLTFLGCHYLDLMRFITGDDFASVSAVTGVVGGEPLPVEDAASVTVGFKSGMVGNLSAGYYVTRQEYGSGRHSGFILWGRDGWLRFNPGGSRRGDPLEWMSHTGAHAGSPHKSWNFSNEDARNDEYSLMTSAFFQSCMTGGPPPLENEAGMWVNEAVQAAYRSSETGMRQAVSIPDVS